MPDGAAPSKTSTSRTFGVEIALDLEEGYPVLVNDPGCAEAVARAGEQVLGAGTVSACDLPMAGEEDFAYYAEKVPATFIFVGAGNKSKGKVYHLHQSRFDIDEDALKVGVACTAYSAYRYLSGRNGA